MHETILHYLLSLGTQQWQTGERSVQPATTQTSVQINKQTNTIDDQAGKGLTSTGIREWHSTQPCQSLCLGRVRRGLARVREKRKETKQNIQARQALCCLVWHRGAQTRVGWNIRRGGLAVWAVLGSYRNGPRFQHTQCICYTTLSKDLWVFAETFL